MAISLNTRLGRYQIRRQLGAGGMGEVYLAFDPKIDRNVAIKILPAGFSSDTERLRRLEADDKCVIVTSRSNEAKSQPLTVLNGTHT